MKKKIKPVLSLALTLALVLSLSVPALAYEDTDPPQWEQWGYSSLEEMLDDGWTEAEYYELAAEQQRRLSWLDAHPDEAAAFDPYAYFAEEYFWSGSAEDYMDALGLTEDDFRRHMLEMWASGQIAEEDAQAELASFLAAHSAEYAAFDPYAYFAEELEFSWCDSAEEYMEWYGMTEEEFRREMLEDWMWDIQYQEETQAALVQEKLNAGGSADGVNVMVNGQCIPFPDVRPEIKNGRTMVPLAAAMEYLGAQVAYDRAGHAVSVSLDGLSFSHAIGSKVLELSDGSSIAMDTASYIKDGRTMVPTAFFAQALGYEVYWDSYYQTAVLLDRQSAADAIDQEFTLVNRILYTLTGMDQRKEGQSLKSTLGLELVITMLDSLNGDKTYSVSLDGSALTNGTASQIQYTADLADLLDLMLDSISYLDDESAAELEAYRKLLSNVSIDIIVDLEGQCLYLRSPIFAELGLVENPGAWAALPLNGLLDTAALAPTELTVGRLLVALSFDGGYSPFSAWQNAMESADEIAGYLSDSCFTRSGAAYRTAWDMTDLLSLLSYYYYSDVSTLTASLKITPSGEKSCTYSLAIKGMNSKFAFDLGLSGSSGKADLDMVLHIKNTLQAALEMDLRITSSKQQPQTQPPAGDTIEHPAGILGVGYLDD